METKEGKCFMHSQATRSHLGKANNYEPKVLNEIMLPMRSKKSLAISHKQHKTPPILTLISPKEKEWDMRKKRKPTPGERKSKKM